MITIHLDLEHDKRLRELARAEGSDAGDVASRILSDYLDFRTMPAESDDAWADASIALAAEVLPPEDWDEGEDGS